MFGADYTDAHNYMDIKHEVWHTTFRRELAMLARLLRLHPSTYKRLVRLSKEAERDGAYRVAKRLQAVVLNSEGQTSGEMARILQAPRSKGSEGLPHHPTGGRDGL